MVVDATISGSLGFLFLLKFLLEDDKLSEADADMVLAVGDEQRLGEMTVGGVNDGTDISCDCGSIEDGKDALYFSITVTGNRVTSTVTYRVSLLTSVVLEQGFCSFASSTGILLSTCSSVTCSLDNCFLLRNSFSERLSLPCFDGSQELLLLCCLFDLSLSAERNKEK